jgi:hypothetical protein
LYDDAIEDTIDADPLAQAIRHMKLTDPNNIDRYANAWRVRRTVISILHNEIAVDLTTTDPSRHHSSSSAA